MTAETYESVPLAAIPELADQADSLIETNFAYSPPHHFKTDFFPLAGPHNLQHRHVLIDPQTKEVVAHIGCRLKTFCWNGQSVPVALLGGITVRADLQGQGLFKRLFLEVLSRYHSQSAFFLLWSDKHEMYANFGFHLAGAQWCYRPPGEEAQGERVQLASLPRETKEKIRDLYQQGMNKNHFSPLRDEADWREIEAITSAELFLVPDATHPRGFYFRGKGMDLGGIVHDWAHQNGFAGLLQDAGSPGVIWAPRNENVPDEVLQELQQVGLWRPNTHSMALSKLSQLLGQEISWQEPHFKVAGLMLLPYELLEEIFGYGKHGLRSSGVPVWVGGLDSV